MSILKNAIDSIEIGLEDYNTGEERRFLSATRNLYAGILLLFKYKLVLLSPPDSDEVLIKTSIKPILTNGCLEWVGSGNKTVDFQDIKKRFNDLNISVDWKILESIQKYRNNIEHYYSNYNKSSVEQLISNSFLVIRDFIVTELEVNPLDLLCKSSWDTMLAINDVYKKEKAERDDAIASLNYLSPVLEKIFEDAICPACGSELIVPEVENENAQDVYIYICRSCNHQIKYKEIVEIGIENYYSYDLHLHIKEGGDSPIAICPECSGTYLYEENVCAECGFESNLECEMCSDRLCPEDLVLEGICSYCNYKREKYFNED